MEQYNQLEDFFKCIHKFEPFKLNFKERYEKCNKFHVLRRRVTCTIYELSVSRRCTLKLYNFIFEESGKSISSLSYNLGTSTEKKIIA